MLYNHLDYVSVARAGMLHDLFLYDWRKRENGRKGLHAFTHPKSAYEIIGYLESCGISAERRSIYKDIEDINRIVLMLQEDIDLEEVDMMIEEAEESGDEEEIDEEELTEEEVVEAALAERLKGQTPKIGNAEKTEYDPFLSGFGL